MEYLTAHLWAIIILVTVFLAGRLLGHAMCIQPVLPFSDFPNLLVAMLILLVIVRAGWIVYVVPVLYSHMLFSILILLPPLSSTPLSLLAFIEPVYIVIPSSPIS